MSNGVKMILLDFILINPWILNVLDFTMWVSLHWVEYLFVDLHTVYISTEYFCTQLFADYKN